MYEFTGYVLLTIAALLWTVCAIPQLIKTYRTKSVGDISLIMVLTSSIAYLMFDLGHLFIRDYYSLVVYLIPSLTSWMLSVLVIKYKGGAILCRKTKKTVMTS